MAEPGGAQGGRQHRRGQHRPWAAEPRQRHGGRATRSQHGRQGGVLGRRGPRGHARRRGAAHTGVRADPVHTDHERGQHDSVAARPPDDQQVLRPRPGPRPQPRRTPPHVGAAGVRHVLAQSRCGRGGLGARHVRGGRAQRARHHEGDLPGRAGAALRRLLGRHHLGAGGGIPRWHRSPGGACRPHPRSHRPRPVRRRAGGSHDGPRPRGSGGGEVDPDWVPRRPVAGRGVRVAAAERSHLELLGQQLPAREEAAERSTSSTGTPTRPVCRPNSTATSSRPRWRTSS